MKSAFSKNEKFLLMNHAFPVIHTLQMLFWSGNLVSMPVSGNIHLQPGNPVDPFPARTSLLSKVVIPVFNTNTYQQSSALSKDRLTDVTSECILRDADQSLPILNTVWCANRTRSSRSCHHSLIWRRSRARIPDVDQIQVTFLQSHIAVLHLRQ